MTEPAQATNPISTTRRLCDLALAGPLSLVTSIQPIRFAVFYRDVAYCAQ
jgi:hypothetical protein